VGKRAVVRSVHAERRGTAAKRVAGLAAVRGEQASRSSLELDRMIHERVRLAIVSALAVNESLTFNELKQLLGTSDGNLSVHARRLEDAGYVECLKSFAGRLPRTEFRLTQPGRDALDRYLSHMEGLISSTRARS
jgi:DNA-binding transcriptional ArsR family regulator